MLCPSCRRQLTRGAGYCGSCGAPLAGADAPLELVLADHTRVPVVQDMVIGRSPGSTVVLADPSVSRVHARISAGNGGGAAIEDAGSSAGTLVDGVVIQSATPLRDGAKLQLGSQELKVERRRDSAEAGRTIVVRPGASLVVPALGPPGVTAAATSFGMKPRVRSGYALKRLEASEGSKRWVLRDLSKGTFMRLSDNDAALFELFDGTHSLADLIGICEQRFGAAGAPRLARLLSDLGERGYLAGVASTSTSADEPEPSRLKRLFRPREKTFDWFGDFFERLYRGGAWVLFTRPALIGIATLVVLGLATFVYLVVGRYGTPFVVSKRIGLGALVFLLGRFAVVAVHEVAHGLTMASFGRRIHKAGLKLMLVFPYAFVDTSEAWFEPRNRRIAISAAGPVSDFSLGAIFSICCLVVEGTTRDVFFQLAFAGYVGAFFNLNPFIDRDGYHMLVDVLREPGLRKRAKDQFSRKLSGGARSTDSPVLARYSIAGVGWSILAAGFAIFMSLRYEPIMSALAPSYVVHIVLGTLWFVLFIPVFIVLGKPLVDRVRGKGAAA